jgi:selenocysteine lyase/cysteine desulfurase
MLTPDTLDGLRRREFARLDRQGIAYLDYTGAALAPASLIRRDGRRLLGTVRGNPHAESGPARESTRALERARDMTLRFVNASPREYDVVFTANASAAIRLVADTFPFERSGHLVLTADNHNSVNGLAGVAWRAGTPVTVAPLDGELRADPDHWMALVRAASLFAYPAQSNFSGVRHPLTWVREAQARGYHVLLDAASFLASARLDLDAVAPDFVALSFYKIFGYPTGVGALVVRRDALSRLCRAYFAGGTVDAVSLPHRIVQRKASAAAFEDGTANYLAMDAVADGLAWFDDVGRGEIADHIAAMTASLLDVLRGAGAIVYGPRTVDARGGTVAFNLVDRDGVIPYEIVEESARRTGVALRGGCFCNPGAAAAAFGFDGVALQRCLRGRFSPERFRQCMPGKAVGALRASVGLATNAEDLEALRRCLALVTTEPDRLHKRRNSCYVD